MSYKPQWELSGEWAGNAQRFATKAEAEASAKARFQVWTAPTEYRAVESDDPANTRFANGRDERICELAPAGAS